MTATLPQGPSLHGEPRAAAACRAHLPVLQEVQVSLRRLQAHPRYETLSSLITL